MKISQNKKIVLIQFIKYFITAGIATLCDWGSYFIFYNKLEINEYLAAVFSFVVWFIINYVLSIIFVFKKSKHKKGKEILILLLTSISALLLNILCLSFFIRIISNISIFTENFSDFTPLLAKIAASCICVVYNFIIRKIFVFE